MIGSDPQNQILTIQNVVIDPANLILISMSFLVLVRSISSAYTKDYWQLFEICNFNPVTENINLD